MYQDRNIWMPWFQLFKIDKSGNILIKKNH